MTPDERKRRLDEYRRAALAKFPFKLIEVPGDQALAKWTELKAAGRGTPVVLGPDDGRGSFENLLLPFGPDVPPNPPPPSVEDILRTADKIRFPDDLAKRKKADSDAARARLKADLAANPNMPLPRIIVVEKDGTRRTLSREETIADMLRDEPPPLGVWPEAPKGNGAANPANGLTVAYDILTGRPFPKVYVGIAPTDDWTAIPAYLRYGSWNACPEAEYHVAAMRTWRKRYGAELVGICSDTINLRVARRPQTRDEALALAREQYVYCSDIIDQGAGTYSALAAALTASDWWYFWWD